MPGERLHADQFMALVLIDKDGDLQKHPAHDLTINSLFNWMRANSLIKRKHGRLELTDAGRAALARHDKGSGQEEGKDA